MKIKNKITVYFSLSTLFLTAVAFIFIYLLFSRNREEEFQLRQKDKITTTLRLLAKIKQTDTELVDEIDQFNINDLFNEKLLLFNANKELIYSSIDDMTIPSSSALLAKLNADNKWIENKDGFYDVIGIYIESNGKTYYGISKAYDTFGYSKLRYLQYILLTTFISISIIIILVSFALSKKITQPLVSITKRIGSYDLEHAYTPIDVVKSHDELHTLALQFNKLMKRMKEVYSFQKHAIHHISHELKTPIAVLVSNFERIEGETNPDKLKSLLRVQKEDTRSLSEIINSLLEISKAETGNVLKHNSVRIDELIFDVADELKNIYPDFLFSIEYEQTEDEGNLTIEINARLIKSALMNLMQNAVQYSNDGKAKVKIGNRNHAVRIIIENNGKVITPTEKEYLFQLFFRGENSKGIRGFGLGLVLVHKIISLHKGSIVYFPSNGSVNTFEVILPLV